MSIDAELVLLGGGHAHGGRGRGGLLGRPPQDRRAAFGADDRIDGVLERDHDVAHGDRQRPAGATLAGDDRHDRRAQAGHQRDGAGDGLGDATFLGLRSGVRARDVHERDDRQPEPLGQLHDAHRLAVPLRVGHPEVAPDVLVGVGPLLLADDRDDPSVDPGEPRDHRLVIAEEAVTMEFDEGVGHLRDQVERPRPAQVARGLDAGPGAVGLRAEHRARAAAIGRGLALGPRPRRAR